MYNNVLAPISTQNTLADIVTERIREAIIRGNLKPGERLTEPSLAAELGVSRSPVREALVRLETEHLVWRESKRGFFVWSPVPSDVDEILNIRVMMESLAADLVIDKLTDEDFANLEDMFEHQRELIEANGHMRLTKEDRRFHDYFIHRSQNKRLLVLWGQVMSQWEVLTYRRMVYFSSVPDTVLSDHRNIIDLMKAKDLNGVVALHREINQRVAGGMKEILEHPPET